MIFVKLYEMILIDKKSAQCVAMKIEAREAI